MEELSAEGRRVYDLLKGGLDEDIDRKLVEQHTGTLKAVRKMFDETYAELDSHQARWRAGRP